LIALVVKSLTGLPLVIDFRDPWARCEWVFEPGVFRERANRWLERICVQHADFVIVNTNALREQFVQAYDKSLHDKIAVLPNGYDPALRDRAEILLNEQTSVHHNEGIRFCHPGAIYGHRSLQPLIASIELLKESREAITLEQVGLVDAESEVIEDIKTRRLEGIVSLLGRQPHDMTLQRMAAADAFVLIQPRTSIQVPGKFFEMLPFRKPILALTDRGETAELVVKYDLGVVASPDSGDAIARAIQQLVHQIREKHNFGWQDALDAFEGRKLTGDLARILDRVSRRPMRATTAHTLPTVSGE
jgi:glycosyltransferase involved in cell wall biosynthesis